MRKIWLIAAAAAFLAVVFVAAYAWFSTPANRSAATAGSGATQTADATAPKLYDDDRILGSADAPVTIIEYASLTCPHCASFHSQSLPQIKTHYIESGKVRLVYRDFPLDGLALRAALLAHCGPTDRYFNLLDVLFRGQRDWATAQNPVAALGQIGRTAGLDQATIDKCLAEKPTSEKIVARMQDAEKEFGIEATPTFIVNGRKLSGALPFEDFEENGEKKQGFDSVLKEILGPS